MKVDIITGSRWGGPQTWARDLALMLIESGVEAAHTYSKRGRVGKLLYENADIVHTTVPTLTKKPTVLTVKGDFTIEDNIYRRLYPRAIKRAQAVTCPSYYLADRLGLQGAAIIPNAVIPENFRVAEPRAKDTIRLMSVANSYFPGKADGLLRLKKMVTAIPDCEWHIFGAGQTPFRAKNIFFHGFVDDLRELYPTFDVFLHYSLHDNFPTVILEAMACLPKGSLILTLPRPIDINKLAANRRVLGSTGQFQKVLAKQRRVFDGTLVEVKGCGLLPFQLTGDHPVQVANIARPLDGLRAKRVFLDKHWKQAGELSTGDFLVFPWQKSPGSRAYLHFGIDRDTSLATPQDIRESVYPKRKIRLDSNLAYLFGFYLADGSCSKTGGIEIDVGRSECDAANLATIIESSLGYKVRREEALNNIRLRFGGPILFRWFKRHFGETARTKHIPSFIMRSTDATAFIQGYLRGDGHVTKTKRLQFTTYSIKIALGLQQLLSRVGVFGSILVAENKKEHTIRGRLVHSSRYRYNVCVGAAQRDKLGLTKVDGKHKSLVLTDWNNRCFYVPITTLNYVPYKGCVFNMTTPDTTYSVSNVIVHNCGLPVLTNQVGAVSEIIESGRDGHIADSDDDYYSALRCLIDSPTLRRMLGIEAQRTIKSKFNWHQIVSQYIDIYKDLVRGSDPVRPVQAISTL